MASLKYVKVKPQTWLCYLTHCCGMRSTKAPKPSVVVFFTSPLVPSRRRSGQQDSCLGALKEEGCSREAWQISDSPRMTDSTSGIVWVCWRFSLSDTEPNSFCLLSKVFILDTITLDKTQQIVLLDLFIRGSHQKNRSYSSIINFVYHCFLWRSIIQTPTSLNGLGSAYDEYNATQIYATLVTRSAILVNLLDYRLESNLHCHGAYCSHG